jgi:hypothetical protein
MLLDSFFTGGPFAPSSSAGSGASSGSLAGAPNVSTTGDVITGQGSKSQLPSAGQSLALAAVAAVVVGGAVWFARRK